jgi:hypothetical protein
LKSHIYLIIVASKDFIFIDYLSIQNILFRQQDIETQYYALALINAIMSKGDHILRSVRCLFFLRIF